MAMSLRKESLREPKINRRDDETFLQFAGLAPQCHLHDIRELSSRCDAARTVPLRAAGRDQNSKEQSCPTSTTASSSLSTTRNNNGEDLVPQCSIQQYLRLMDHKRTVSRSSADNLVSSSANRSS